jgi:hypothetical protein
VAALGLAMIANPEQPSFRERVGRLKTIGRSDR